MNNNKTKRKWETGPSFFMSLYLKCGHFLVCRMNSGYSVLTGDSLMLISRPAGLEGNSSKQTLHVCRSRE